MNEACRSHKKPFYAGGTYGLLGYIFCDLMDHEYISPYVINAPFFYIAYHNILFFQGPICIERCTKKCQNESDISLPSECITFAVDRSDKTANKGIKPGRCFYYSRCVICGSFNAAYSQKPSALWEFQSKHRGLLPCRTEDGPELQMIADALLQTADVNKQALNNVPSDLIQYVCCPLCTDSF